MTAQQSPRPNASPRLPRESLLVVATGCPEAEIDCAQRYGVGVEIQSFAVLPLLEDPLGPALAEMAQRLEGRFPRIGAHGPFMDTVHCSPDPEVRTLAKRRYLQAFDVATALRAEYVIFHSQYNVLVKIATYPDLYHDMSLRFWPEILEEAAKRGLNVYVENMFDERPEALRRLADALDAPNFGLCLDIAHVSLHSVVPVADWAATLGPRLRHVHINDNRGTFDDHLGLGQGVLDLDAAFDALHKTRLPLTYTIETNGHAEVSLDYLGIAPIEDADKA